MDRLQTILDDLQKHHRDKSSIMEQSISIRLAKSVENYYKELSNSFEYLSHRDNIRVMKQIIG